MPVQQPELRVLDSQSSLLRGGRRATLQGRACGEAVGGSAYVTGRTHPPTASNPAAEAYRINSSGGVRRGEYSGDGDFAVPGALAVLSGLAMPWCPDLLRPAVRT